MLSIFSSDGRRDKKRKLSSHGMSALSGSLQASTGFSGEGGHCVKRFSGVAGNIR